MALTVRPADGLIHRLLQQNSQAAGKPQTEKAASIRINDQVNISQHGKEMGSSENSAVDSRQQNQSKLESQLLRLYTQHSSGKDEK
ncbi:MAG: hypothetical protein ABUK11_06455 [Mariprofundaceae bacterium]